MRDFTSADRAAMRSPAFSLRYRRAAAHDAGYDGWFVFASQMSGNFCRPGCSTRTPRPSQVSFFATAAAAWADGWTPCPRCRPDRTPDRPHWWRDDDVAARALRLIADGEIARDGVDGLAAKVGVSSRQVRRAVSAATGCGPLAVARARRGMMARLLLADTAIPIAEVANAAGFATTRQFNATIRQLYGVTPSRLRPGPARHPRRPETPARWYVRCRMPTPRHLTADVVLAALAAHPVPGVEYADAGFFARAVRLPRQTGYLRLDSDSRGRLWASLTVLDPRDFIPLYARARALAGLDSGPDRHGNPQPGCVDPDEMVLRSLITAQVATPGEADALLEVVTHTLGEVTPWGLLFPSATRVAAEGARVLPDRITAVASALARGQLEVHYGVSRAGLASRLRPYVGDRAEIADRIAARVLGRGSASDSGSASGGLH